MIFNHKFQTLDGRWFIGTVLLVYFSFLIIAEFFFGSYEKIWSFFGVHSVRSFSDLNVLLCGIEEYLQKRDPYAWVKCTYNYPLLWVLFSYIPYFHSAYLNQIGILLIVLFFLSILLFIKKVSFRDSLIYSGLLISPAIMLALERGNCDVILFLLLLLSLFFLSKNYKSRSYLLLLFSAFLKLYPIVGFMYVLEQVKTKKMLFLTGLGVALVFSLYLLAIQEQLKPISKIHPRSFFISYGIYTLPIRIYTKFSYFRLETLKMGALIITILGCFYFILAQGFSVDTKDRTIDKAQPVFFNAYLVGSSIFISTFIAGNNFDYRLIFLILTFPQLLHWLNVPHLKTATHFQLLILGLILWNSFLLEKSMYLFHTGFIINVLDEALIWVLFFIHIKFSLICRKRCQ